MAKDFFGRVKQILQSENVSFDDKVVAELVKKHFPDFRRVINELQRYSQFGKIDTGLLTQIADVSISEIVKHMREKDFSSIRKWVAYGEYDPNTVFRQIYDALYEIIKPQSIPQAVLILADYQYKQAFVADGEINLVACLVELMSNCDFA
jgi:DNA polymerase III delta prime subunit